MTRILTITLALLLATGCSTARDYATLALYRAEHKVLMFSLTPCAQSNATKPAMVSAWVRERDVDKMVVQCDTECNCRLTKRTPEMKMATKPESGICQ